MRPIYISIKNYRSYGDKEEKLYLDGNTTRILIGKNGAGKTTHIDAMMWCLFGKSASAADKVINRINKKNTKVEFSFDIGKDNFIVTRYRKDDKYGDDVFLYKNNKNITPTKKKDAQSLIAEYIGVTYQTLINSIVFSKETFNPFLENTPTKRLSVLESVLNLKPIAIWADEVKREKGDIMKVVIEKKQLIEKAEFGIETLITSKENFIQEKTNNIERTKREINKLKEELSSLEEDINKFTKIDIEKEKDILKKLKDYEEGMKFFNEKISNEEDKLINIDNEVKQYNEDKLSIISLEKINVNEELRKIEDEEKRKTKNKEIKLKIEALDAKIENKTNIENKIKELETLIKIIDKDLGVLKENKCHTCGHMLNEEKTKALLGEKQKEKEKSENELKEVKENLLTIEERNKSIRENIEKISNELDLKEIKCDFSKQQLLDNKEIIDKLKNRISLNESIIETNSKKNKGINKEIDELKRKKRVLTEQKDSENLISNYSEDVISSITDIIKNKNNEISNIKEKIVYKENDLIEFNKETDFEAKAEEKIKSLNEIIEKNNKDLIKNEIKLKYFNLLGHLLSNKDSGLKKYIINRMIPEFNKKINEYLPYFFENNISVIFDKELNDTIILGKDEVAFNEFSSGEKLRLELAISISLFMLVKTYFSSSISFVVFDEILDMNLDDDGIKSVFGIIDGLSNDNSVIVISHKEQYKEYFKNRIIISRDKKGFSKISQD